MNRALAVALVRCAHPLVAEGVMHAFVAYFCAEDKEFNARKFVEDCRASA